MNQSVMMCLLLWVNNASARWKPNSICVKYDRIAPGQSSKHNVVVINTTSTKKKENYQHQYYTAKAHLGSNWETMFTSPFFRTHTQKDSFRVLRKQSFRIIVDTVSSSIIFFSCNRKQNKNIVFNQSKAFFFLRWHFQQEKC